MNVLWGLFNIRPRAQENEQRVIRIYDSKRKLDAARDKYRLAITNRRLEARTYAREGHLKLARNALVLITYYTKNLDMVADLLLNVERIMAARERADLLQTTGSVMKDIFVWMKQTVVAMEKENPISDQAVEIDAMMRTIDSVQLKIADTAESGVRLDLSPEEMAAIDDELLEMREDDYTDEPEHEVYMDVQLPRRQNTFSLLAEEASS